VARNPFRGRRVGGWLLTGATLIFGIVLPALAYALIDSVLPGSIPNLQYVVACAYGLTAMMTLLEARAALGTRDQPETAHLESLPELAELPTLTAIVSAYLPNEQELVVETIVHLATELRVAPGRLQIILAYNTPDDMPDVECVLGSLAALNVAFTPLRVPESRSKAENINAAMELVRGEVTDHRPARDAAVRALRWFGAGYDIVQGRCVIREHAGSWLARIVAVEFEQIYAVAHAGRSLAFDTAMFGGTNGWWRTSVLRQIGMNDQMLTEDIDSSVRALLAGHRHLDRARPADGQRLVGPADALGAGLVPGHAAPSGGDRALAAADRGVEALLDLSARLARAVPAALAPDLLAATGRCAARPGVHVVHEPVSDHHHRAHPDRRSARGRHDLQGRARGAAPRPAGLVLRLCRRLAPLHDREEHGGDGRQRA
jgi:hypothetical protein